jgi:DNA replication protein DnaC
MMDEELKKKLTYLHLKGLLDHWDQYLCLAQNKDFSPVRFLTYIIEQEYKIKEESAKNRRIARAQIRDHLVMETFPFENQPKLNKKKILNLYDSLEYMRKNQNIIWIGPTGSGKSGLATAFLIHAIHHGWTGRFILFPDLIDILYKSRGIHTEEKVLKKFVSYDCLLIDELGYLEIEPVQVGLFFTLMHKRHQRKTTLITSNIGFQQWACFLKNDPLTAALIDRLTENSHVINMKACVSLRPKLYS